MKTLGIVVLLGLLLSACAKPPPEEPVPPLDLRGGLAVDGYDPVAYFTEGEPVLGKEEHELHWQGATYRFASDENRRAFQADPERYAPRYGGYCAVAMSWNSIAEGNPHHWAIVEDRLYLNNNGFAHFLWNVGRDGNIEEADRNWEIFPLQEPAAD